MSIGVTDQELRALVRDAIARLKPRASFDNDADRLEPRAPADGAHPSHFRLPLARGGDGDGACLIEPSVRCTHCGYCQSYGH
ncbi:MAG: hypothetical protein ACM3SQ_10770 [Betaproteobacteria bacterium]